MNRLSTTVLTLTITAALASCSEVRSGLEAPKQAVARVAGHTLTVEHAARLLSMADEEMAPPVVTIVYPIADLWAGYTLLAMGLASPDTFGDVDLAPLTQFGINQELAWSLREGEIMPRLEPSEEELLASYERDQPYTTVEAYHILIRIPDSASAAAVDSLRRIAENLRGRAAAGEDFEELARRYSDDPATSSRGGWLGIIARGRVVPEVEDVALRMQPGEISETVRSNLGYHIVKVTDRNEPDFEEVRGSYRMSLINRDVQVVEGAYIDSLFAAANVRDVPGAVRLVRRMVFNPRLENLSPAERKAALVRYRGGELTLGEWADFITPRSDNMRNAFAGDSAEVVRVLHEIVRNELLAKAARDLGYGVPQSKVDSLENIARRDLFSAAAVSGMRRHSLDSGDQTIEEAVDQILEQLLTRQRSPAPLRRVALGLKSGHTIQIYPDRFPEVIERLQAIRSGQVEVDESEAVSASPAAEH